jgi:pimeloyl-ACP methyl ester carboxylesterase
MAYDDPLPAPAPQPIQNPEHLVEFDYGLHVNDQAPTFPHARRHGGLGLAGALLLGTAATLGAAALYVGARSRAAEAAHPPAGKFIEVDGVRLHVAERGVPTGRPLVLLHGLAMLAEDFLASPFLELAARDHRILVFDRPGYGYSERPDDRDWTPREQARLIARAWRRMGVERPVVVGHSFGTSLAMALALDRPDLVAGIVLLSGYYYPTTRFDFPAMAAADVPVIGTVHRHTLQPILMQVTAPAFFEWFFAPNPVPQRFRERFPTGLAFRPEPLRANGEDAGLFRPWLREVMPRYRELVVPAGIMHGVGEQVADAHFHSARLHGEIPQAAFALLPDTGHMIHHIRPREVMEMVRTVEARAG